MRALYAAATGMAAQELNVQVISNNIANLRTTGYKRQQPHFQDLLYQNLRRAGASTSDQNTQLPAGLAIGSGVKTVSTARIMSQGTLTSTEKDYDVAIRGEGFFRVTMPDGRTAYSRDGSFDLSAQGQLVTRDGYLVDPGVTVPNTATAVTISATGAVQATLPGQTAPQSLGQFQLARFVNKTGLESIGDNLFIETAASGPAVAGLPGGEGFGNLQQSYLEEANVNAVTEISSLIAAQRAYEMNSKVVTAADQMLSTTSQMFRS
ncbi:Flagellar basal-body rod protein FlgG [Methylobacterium cerastii]|uniref:Flagellar basal-body rod protein FlgG n=1 Tax=Methylobacterium cerastii TaxID=932741 RepID=A0ABQ4QGM0_9HYPH|nr:MULTISPECIES: flagellar basal-body rod protein FlgG [Methylobacterium]TXM97748.1 flagellar basal-body rod protein FlgG [Methylobacterium sp. WL122]TXM60945.1 flagellar basal-body rod protein FlgG [Methylobacterium sp. WL120]TXM67485.1 flagellar basal-body rod protein FlgG [Methylobacterium sp. WL12]TXM96168.1 flagellar basal-body rod protein FlgG [Methylobacterium sp. WL103]TXN78891.1 flagellar basal-body rod protein FlgG [Methylobacterium sp. WL8]